MFAYCNNDPTNLLDRSGNIPDTFAGWFGELLGEVLYEMFTGNDHPSHETDSVEREIIKTQVDTVISFIESDEFQDVANSDEVKGLKGLNKIRSGGSLIKKGFKMLFVPIPTEAEDVVGVGLITLGVIKGSWGVVEVVISWIGGND